MTTLFEIQSRFTDYVLRDLRPDKAAEGIRSIALSAEQRLAIYRNNTQLGLTETLRDGYPVVNKLVGTDFFKHLAHSYVRQHPPKAGCLLYYGGNFADFISDFPAAAGLPYLPDVARLEWLWHEAFHEADASALDMAKLATVAPDAYSKLGFTLHPNARFLAASFPILKIWQANQEGYKGNGHINLDEGGCQFLIYRPQLEVEIIPLDEANYLFLTLLHKEFTLTQAVDQVVKNKPDFDVKTAMQHWMAIGLITDFYINN
jgi:hypothetical protein